MVYSKLRGFRKPKPKKDEQSAAVIKEKDAFQEQGQRFIDEIISHPYFIIGSVVAVIGAVILFLALSNYIQDSRAKETAFFTDAMKVWDAKVGSGEEFISETDKMKKASEKFSEAASRLEGSFMGDVSLFYAAKANYRMKEYEKAGELFKKVQNAKSIPETLKFGAFEGEAFCHLDRNDFEKTIFVWQKYLDSIKSSFYKDQAVYQIAETYEKSGNKEKAMEYYKKLKAEYPESKLVVKIMDKLPSEEKAPEVPAGKS